MTEKCKELFLCTLNLLFWSQDSRSRNQFFDDVNLDHITPQIPEGEQDMSERQNGIQCMSAQCSPILTSKMLYVCTTSSLIFFFSEGKTSLFGPDMHLGRCSRVTYKCVIIFARKMYLAEADKGMMLDWSKADLIKHNMIRKSDSNTSYSIT